MYNINVPESNSLKAQIEELIDFCSKIDNESGTESSYFEEPIDESEMSKWEEENGVKIPESYKDWLRFSRKCQIDQTTATFWGPHEFHSNYVPEDLIVIGEMIGDGEVVCFSKTTGKIINYFEGNTTKEDANFDQKIKDIIDILRGNCGLSKKAQELFMKFEQKNLERRNKEE